MKKVLLTLFLFAAVVTKISAQEQEAQQLALNIEKLVQFKQILSSMKKGYQLLSTGYGTIKDLSEGNFNLHKTFLDALMNVSPAIRKYKRIGEITDNQLLIIKEYKTAFNRFKQDKNFNPAEIDYLGKVYSNLFNKGIEDLEELTITLTDGTLRMSDDERLHAIDRIGNSMQDRLAFLRYFNNSTAVLAVQRAREKKDASTLKMLYGITN